MWKPKGAQVVYVATPEINVSFTNEWGKVVLDG